MEDVNQQLEQKETTTTNCGNRFKKSQIMYSDLSKCGRKKGEVNEERV